MIHHPETEEPVLLFILTLKSSTSSSSVGVNLVLCSFGAFVSRPSLRSKFLGDPVGTLEAKEIFRLLPLFKTSVVSGLSQDRGGLLISNNQFCCGAFRLRQKPHYLCFVKEV